jgi:hypothetical protein
MLMSRSFVAGAGLDQETPVECWSATSDAESRESSSCLLGVRLRLM